MHCGVMRLQLSSANSRSAARQPNLTLKSFFQYRIWRKAENDESFQGRSKVLQIDYGACCCSNRARSLSSLVNYSSSAFPLALLSLLLRRKMIHIVQKDSFKPTSSCIKTSQ